jgi:hypothetical protein
MISCVLWFLEKSEKARGSCQRLSSITVLELWDTVVRATKIPIRGSIKECEADTAHILLSPGGTDRD